MLVGFSVGGQHELLPFPSFGVGLLLFGLALALVHVSQRLVERSALVVEPTDRKAAFAHTAVAIGSLVWAVDALGLLFYHAFSGRDVRLMPTLAALVLMVITTRWTVPALTVTRRSAGVVLAGLGLAVGMLCAHLSLLLAFGSWTGDIRWGYVVMAIVGATSLAVTLSFRHRAARLRAMDCPFHPLSWFDKALAAFFVLPLHWCLANVLPLESTGGAVASSYVLVGLLLASVMLLVLYQWQTLQADYVRQRLMNRALSSIRTNTANHNTIEQPLALIAERLPQLLRQEKLQLHYQPLVPLRGGGSRVRFEALLRVSDNDLGQLSPEMFLLACEQTGQTDRVDRAILLRALHDSAAWRGSAHACAGISVNITPNSLITPDFLPWLSSHLKALQVPDGWLQLEMTEHALMSSPSALTEVLKQLRTLGVAVVMDDFGTGFSSLGVLVDLPIQGIKCDRSFVRTLEHDVGRQVLLHYMCAMAQDLQLHMTVEGVETADALAIVKSKGVDSVQGFIYAKPMPSIHVADWLSTTFGLSSPPMAALTS